MPTRSGYPCCPNGSHGSCHYAFYVYKTRLACFRCRKAFKRQEVEHPDEDRRPRCPECGGEDVHDMGVGFCPPPRSKVREWQRLAALAAVGTKFLCCGGARQPRGALDHRELLARRRRRARMLA